MPTLSWVCRSPWGQPIPTPAGGPHREEKCGPYGWGRGSRPSSLGRVTLGSVPAGWGLGDTQGVRPPSALGKVLTSQGAGPARLCAPPQHPGSPSPCLRPLPRSTPSARMTSCVAWSAQGPSSPASSRATGWASTGGWTVGRVLGPLLLVAMPIPQHTASAHTCCPLPPTGGFSSPPILMAGTDSGTKRWPRSWRPCTSRPSVRR